MPRNCHGLSIKGSGYVKPEQGADSSKMAEEMKKMMEARAMQDTKYFPQTPAGSTTQDPKKK
jgi:hypothetical protein